MRFILSVFFLVLFPTITLFPIITFAQEWRDEEITCYYDEDLLLGLCEERNSDTVFIFERLEDEIVTISLDLRNPQNFDASSSLFPEFRRGSISSSGNPSGVIKSRHQTIKQANTIVR